MQSATHPLPRGGTDPVQVRVLLVTAFISCSCCHRKNSRQDDENTRATPSTVSFPPFPVLDDDIHVLQQIYMPQYVATHGDRCKTKHASKNISHG
jgi:hypothetical protein